MKDDVEIKSIDEDNLLEQAKPIFNKAHVNKPKQWWLFFII